MHASERVMSGVLVVDDREVLPVYASCKASAAWALGLWARPSTSGKVSLLCLFEFVFLLSFCTFTFTFLYFQVMSFESKPTGLLKTKKKTKKTQKSTDTFPDEVAKPLETTGPVRASVSTKGV
jgi:hypothetical protein